ncbi:hypothetical protein IC762_17865 [Bradyrhizobium genosp. L]|uniref:hypothetical protein n=1 Tax=Bradyrhizobium genosp. L TaxID=83637 RepID=UPI0018A281AE|nr:hypothetical protein [Bradyrhizobium genosp. L]QPF81690.1 hypothetical protein IC762_17865 [Bradyrhizobium genosp. L]
MLLISTAQAQPFGGSAAEGTNGFGDAVYHGVMGVLVLALLVAVFWPALKRLVRAGLGR